MAAVAPSIPITPSAPTFALGLSTGLVNVLNPDGSLQSSTTAYVGFNGTVDAVNAVNRDGTTSVITGTAVGSSHVKVFNSSSGAEVHSFLAFDEFQGGVRVGSADVNADGNADIIVGTATGYSHIKVFSGSDGSLLYSFFAFDQTFTGGISVGSGDVTGDGKADIIVGAATGSSHVRVFSGADGTLVRSFFAFGPTYTVGVNVGAGELDGDGFADLLVGANTNGHVKAFSGATSAESLSFSPYPNYAGAVRVGAVDTNGDGRAELLTSAANHVKRFADQPLAELDSFFVYVDVPSRSIQAPPDLVNDN